MHWSRQNVGDQMNELARKMDEWEMSHLTGEMLTESCTIVPSFSLRTADVVIQKFSPGGNSKNVGPSRSGLNQGGGGKMAFKSAVIWGWWATKMSRTWWRSRLVARHSCSKEWSWPCILVIAPCIRPTTSIISVAGRRWTGRSVRSKRPPSTISMLRWLMEDLICWYRERSTTRRW